MPSSYLHLLGKVDPVIGWPKCEGRNCLLWCRGPGLGSETMVGLGFTLGLGRAGHLAISCVDLIE